MNRILVSIAIIIFLIEYIVAPLTDIDTGKYGTFIGLILLSIAVLRLSDNEKS
ncbi:hypothetical protein RSC2_00336 [Bacillus paralicheniformis]|nr:putative membrane protein [Bacillus paralicheniformis]BCE06746.1 hypothetical protein RSC1_02903 [Bacillus paralicheniformis]BCE08540.1 hypothetical protein RSC2_00336 [Bacillus paralicheniformis]BCE14634.1 hypothetical protein RSC3_01990 [Bacillus paralicheniformis]